MIIIEKFSQNPELKEQLISTGDTLLVKASPYDKVWGIGLNEQDGKYKPLRGENLLGNALMEVRKLMISNLI